MARVSVPLFTALKAEFMRKRRSQAILFPGQAPLGDPR